MQEDLTGNGTFTTNPFVTGILDYQENVTAAYTQFGSKYNKISYLFGLRMEDSFIVIDQISNAIKDTSNAALKEGATSAAIGAAIGAAAGAVIQGGSSQNIGTGAGVGLLGGAAMGAMNASGKQNQAQAQYNIAYQQCMYSKGNQVPSYPSQGGGPNYRPPSSGFKPIQ